MELSCESKQDADLDQAVREIIEDGFRVELFLGSLLVFTQDRPYEGKRIYAPFRAHNVSSPRWRTI